MAPAESNEYPHLNRIMEINREISKMGIFKIFSGRYWELLTERDILIEQGIQIGITIALKDLEEIGILKRITPPSEVIGK